MATSTDDNTADDNIGSVIMLFINDTAHWKWGLDAYRSDSGLVCVCLCRSCTGQRKGEERVKDQRFFTFLFRQYHRQSL